MNEEKKERRFPIYRIKAMWTEDGDSERVKWWPDDPGPGRIWSATGFDRMYREDQDIAELEKWATEEWWPKFLEQEPGSPTRLKVKDRDPKNVSIEVAFSHREEWCLRWFEHWTFDDGQTDREALRSFENFVQRHEVYQNWPYDERTDEELEGLGVEKRLCLMGAEDRWRWHGGPSPDDRSDAPCRCEYCKEQGVIRIAH